MSKETYIYTKREVYRYLKMIHYKHTCVAHLGLGECVCEQVNLFFTLAWVREAFGVCFACGAVREHGGGAAV